MLMIGAPSFFPIRQPASRKSRLRSRSDLNFVKAGKIVVRAFQFLRPWSNHVDDRRSQFLPDSAARLQEVKASVSFRSEFRKSGEDSRKGLSIPAPMEQPC